MSGARLSARCAGCGAVVALSPDASVPWSCPQRRDGDDIDHVMVPERALDVFPDTGEANPFLRYRPLLASYQWWRQLGGSDTEFVELVGKLDQAVAAVDGRGFRITPLSAVDGIGWVKDETGNVAGSHKGRHLMGLMLHLHVAERLSGAAAVAPLAIASCGNAALAAAVVARAAERHLDVYVPASANPDILARLRSLGATVTVCPRREGEIGDPSYLAFRRAVAAGALPFSCQGSDNGLTIDGGATLGWELADQLASAGAQPTRLFVQVGGGALASSVMIGLGDAVCLGVLPRLPALLAVQTTGASPLARAYRRVAERVAAGEAPDKVLAYAATHRSQFMWPWETEPRSVAHGILDDETYDWLAVVGALLASGGQPVVVDEAGLEEANRLARKATGLVVDHTGSAGLAGALALGSGRPVGGDVVLFTGSGSSPS